MPTKVRRRTSLPPREPPRRRGVVAGAAAAMLTVGACFALFQPFSSSPDALHAAPAVERPKPVPVAPPAPPAASSRVPLHVGGAPYVVELERQVANDPSSIVLRIRPKSDDNQATLPAVEPPAPPPQPKAQRQRRPRPKVSDNEASSGITNAMLRPRTL